VTKEWSATSQQLVDDAKYIAHIVGKCPTVAMLCIQYPKGLSAELRASIGKPNHDDNTQFSRKSNTSCWNLHVRDRPFRKLPMRW
jgi:hypothetical protein